MFGIERGWWVVIFIFFILAAMNNFGRNGNGSNDCYIEYDGFSNPIVCD